MSFRNTSNMQSITSMDVAPMPIVIFSNKSLAIMKYIVDNIDKEVAWLGSVSRLSENTYSVEDIYLPKQETASTTCEITDEGFHELYNNIMESDKKDNVDKLNLWGHSHVNMGVSPSQQDLTDSKRMFGHAADNFFIRVICNKSGEMSVAFYDGANKRIIENLAWYINDGVDRKEIDKVYGPLLKSNVADLRPPVVTTPAYTNRADDYSFLHKQPANKSFDQRWSNTRKRAKVSLKGADHGY